MSPPQLFTRESIALNPNINDFLNKVKEDNKENKVILDTIDRFISSYIYLLRIRTLKNDFISKY